MVGMIEIDGSMGEGGGQILRTALGLAAVTGTGFRMHSVRARRSRPGLARQHLASVRAVARLCDARVAGDGLGSTELTFRPGALRAGRHRFSTGGAGSATLVLQALLPPLLTASGPSEVELEGGTHTLSAPPFEFVDRTLAPLLRRMGAGIELELARPGFYPAGGGRMRVRIEPGSLEPLDLPRRGPILGRSARAIVSALPAHIARRELDVVAAELGLDERDLETVEVPDPVGPGNVLLLAVESEAVTELFTGFGRRGVRAERVAEEAVRALRAYEGTDVPVGRHLADQLLVPLALAGGGRFRTMEPTSHARTVALVIPRFLGAEVHFRPADDGRWEIRVEGRS